MRLSEFVKPVEFHSELNPELWDGETLLPEAQATLLRNAMAFYKDLEVEGVPLVDVVITGSNCNTTYTRHSDIDLHIIIDMDRLEGSPEVIEQFFHTKKNLWNRRFDPMLRGIPIEIYVEDNDETVEGSVYSLLQDTWLQRKPLEQTQYDDRSVKAKYKFWSRELKQAIKQAETKEELAEIRERVREYRRAGLADNGEFSTENLTFKALRNAGLFDKLQKRYDELMSQELSLESLSNKS